jgi:Carboxypeptidase regulatory-like domain/Short C-terminal domain
MNHSLGAPRIAVLGLLVLSTGCAMRVTGVVRDGSTGSAIGGAVLTANDGRNRLTTTDPAGRFAVKTDRRPSTLAVSAPGFVTTTVQVPDSQRFPVANIDLQRSVPGAPAVSQVERGASRPVTAYTDTGVTAKLQQLQELHDRGLISDDEYRRTRTHILQGM